MFGLRERTLNHLTYRYWRKNKNRSGDDNWKLSELLLQKLEKRYGIDRYKEKEDKPSLLKRMVSEIRSIPNGD